MFADEFLGGCYFRERVLLPVPAAGDVSQQYLVHGIGRLLLEACLEFEQFGMYAQLQQGVNFPSRFGLDFFERVQVPRVDDQRLLTNRICPHAQGQPAVSIVQVVGRANVPAPYGRGGAVSPGGGQTALLR